MEVGALWFNTQFTLARMPYYFKLKKLAGKVVKPSFQVQLENQFYEVKTVNEFEELVQVLRLRFEVFFQEFSTQKVSSIFPYDIDFHDFLCDHLIVKDKSNGMVVACYRLLSTNSGQTIKHFYSEGEFVLDELLKLPGHKLELGRACVHKDYRKGTVISLLWKGLLEYARASKTRYMFGCSSINRKDFQNLPHILDKISSRDGFIEEIKIGVQPKYQMKFSVENNGDETAAKDMGSLMNMYLLAGAKMGKTLAYDAEMDCLDMFTLMDIENLPQSFERRFS